MMGNCKQPHCGSEHLLDLNRSHFLPHLEDPLKTSRCGPVSMDAKSIYKEGLLFWKQDGGSLARSSKTPMAL